MVKVGQVNVAFVGAVLEDTPTVVTPSGIAGLEFRDEAASINAVMPEIMAQKPDAVIALIHQGGTAQAKYDELDCSTLQGPVVDVVRALDKNVSAVMTGHTHQGYSCRVDGRVVVQGEAQGHLLQRLDLTIDLDRRAVTAVEGRNVFVDPAGPKDARMTEIVARADELTKPVASRVVATLGAEQITRKANAAGESALGDVIADSQLAATRAPEFGGAVIAFMNPGGIRADLPGTPNPAMTVTYGEVFTVQPFGNLLTVMTLTGAQIKTLLEQQLFEDTASGPRRILQVSEGFAYTWDQSRPTGDKVVKMSLNGQPIDPAAAYRVTVNSFLADGGDNFTVLREGKDRLGGALDIDAFQNYLKAAPVKPGPQNRITRLN
ncbi:bifunctional metallophosphatase/5'-nucleotidase [Deinococcus lacus]